MTQVDIAVVGLGFMGSRWARCVAEHPGARLRIVSDLEERLGRGTAERWEAEFVPDPLEAAAHSDVQGVVVCTPEHAHVGASLAAIDAGKAVAVEKPLAHTVEGAERIRDRAAREGVPVLVGHILRFEPRFAAVADALERGELGEVQAVRHERIGLIADQQVLGGRTSVSLYYGVHEFDLARWFAGDIARIHAVRSEGVLKAHGYDVEDLYSALLQFDSGAHGTAMLGWCLPDRMLGYGLGGVTVIGSEGAVRVDQGEVGVVKVDADGTLAPDVYYSPEVHGSMRGAIATEIDHFVACATGTAEPLCTADDGTEAVRVALAMERSADLGRPVAVRTRVPMPTGRGG